MKSGLVIIPARAGSKRIPQKNSKPFLGKPLIHWTLEAALNSSFKPDVLVSTDDPVILSYASDFPEVNFLRRPAELATDASPTLGVILHAMGEQKKSYDFIALLQATSPLRDFVTLDKALNDFLLNHHKQMVSVRRCREIPSHIFIENQDGFIKPLLQQQVQTRSQDWSKVWTVNGAIYLSEWDYLLDKKSFFTDQTKPFVMSDERSIDIDTEDDWALAENLAKRILP